MSTELTLYRDLLADIKTRVRQAQHKAALSANSEMILMYWDIGRMIAARQEQEGWGAGVIPKLAVDLKNELPEEKGFSERNIKRMLRFFREYPVLQRPTSKLVPRPAALLESPNYAVSAIVPQAAAQLDSDAGLLMPPGIAFGIPWFHHIILIEKIKHLPTRLWYARQVMEHGWSRDTLTVQIKLCRIPFYAAWLVICPIFLWMRHPPMRHKTGTCSQSLEIDQQFVIGSVSPWFALHRIHFGEDGFL